MSEHVQSAGLSPQHHVTNTRELETQKFGIHDKVKYSWPTGCPLLSPGGELRGEHLNSIGGKFMCSFLFYNLRRDQTWCQSTGPVLTLSLERTETSELPNLELACKTCTPWLLGS